MPLFYVKIRKNIDICNYLPIYYPAICRGWGTFSVPSLGEVVVAATIIKDKITPAGKRVSLLIVTTITTVMHGMTPAAATIKKAAFGRSKSPADAGKKIADCGSPSPALPKGRESILAVFYAVGWNSLPLGGH